MLVFLFLCNHAFASDDVRLELDVSHRPPKVLSAIGERYETLSQKEESNWAVFNGQKTYGIIGINDKEFVEDLLLKHAENKQDNAFNILDVGAGNFDWGDNIACLVKRMEMRFPVNIISIRGEAYRGDERSQDQNCTIYKFGNVNAEYDIVAQLKARRKDLQIEQFGLIVSSWCLCHLVDPVGTLQLLVNKLAPAGIMLATRFQFLYQSDQGYEAAENLPSLLYDTGLPFVLGYAAKSQDGFALQKETSVMKLPMNYVSIQENGKGYSTIFKRVAKLGPFVKKEARRWPTFQGRGLLFKNLKQFLSPALLYNEEISYIDMDITEFFPKKEVRCIIFDYL